MATFQPPIGSRLPMRALTSGTCRHGCKADGCPAGEARRVRAAVAARVRGKCAHPESAASGHSAGGARPAAVALPRGKGLWEGGHGDPPRMEGPACPEGVRPAPFRAHRFPAVVVVGPGVRMPRGAPCLKSRPMCTRDGRIPTGRGLSAAWRLAGCQKARPACTRGARYLTEGALAVPRLSEIAFRVYTRDEIVDRGEPPGSREVTLMSKDASHVYTRDATSDGEEPAPIKVFRRVAPSRGRRAFA